jgi:hypothetical protein
VQSLRSCRESFRNAFNAGNSRVELRERGKSRVELLERFPKNLKAVFIQHAQSSTFDELTHSLSF